MTQRSRRTVLAGITSLASLSLAGCSSSTDTTQTTEPTTKPVPDDAKDWLADANNYDHVIDKTQADAVTIEVGVGENGLAFGPAAVRVSPGTTVQWEWTGNGGTHNVVGERFMSPLYNQQGETFTHTFDEAGVYKYSCRTHRGQHMKGAVIVEAQS